MDFFYYIVKTTFFPFIALKLSSNMRYYKMNKIYEISTVVWIRKENYIWKYDFNQLHGKTFLINKQKWSTRYLKIDQLKFLFSF